MCAAHEEAEHLYLIQIDTGKKSERSRVDSRIDARSRSPSALSFAIGDRDAGDRGARALDSRPSAILSRIGRLYGMC